MINRREKAIIKDKGYFMNEYTKYVEKHRQLILDSLDYIWKNPETGYKEWKTHKYMKEVFDSMASAMSASYSEVIAL